MLIRLIIIAFFLVGCGSDSGESVQYIDRTELIYVDRNVTEYVDRNVTEYVDRTELIYVDRNVTEYVDRTELIYVDRTEYIYVDRNITEYIDVEPLECYVQEFDSTFTGRIVYPDKTPYKRGSVRVQGNGWENYAITDDDGIFHIGVKGDDRFLFSAYSPYGDYTFYSYATPLLVSQYETYGAYECEYDTVILECYETPVIK